MTTESIEFELNAEQKSDGEARALDSVVVRLAGDSGDGIQITGQQFSQTRALSGNDVQTYPDFPAEIRAPAGTLAGVSGFQVHFSADTIRMAGDRVDVLIAMNPAALRQNIAELKLSGILIVNDNNFVKKEWEKVGYQADPLAEEALKAYQIIRVPLTDLTLKAVNDSGLTHSQAAKCKNMYALGILYYLYDCSLEPTLTWLQEKYHRRLHFVSANQRALRAGYDYADTTELFAVRYTVSPAGLPSGRYRQVNGNEALALACAVTALKTEQPIFVAGYPITPASTILHDLAHYTRYGVITFQAEDEIAAVGAAIGAAFGGSLAVTTTSGPGFDLKTEGLGLAVMTELPLVVLDIQRAGPSTGMPTKPEQSDLLAAIYGRHGECPIPVLAAATPSDCYHLMLAALQIAVRYMTPVILLSDGALAMGSEPWLIPSWDSLPEMYLKFHTETEGFHPYQRNPTTLARPWVRPGTPGLEHRIGGLEKEAVTGNVSYDPANHEKMVTLRAKKVAAIADCYPSLTVEGPEQGELLIVSWGGTYGSLRTAVECLWEAGYSVSQLHLRHLNPLPRDLSGILKRFRRILVPEMNLGQLSRLLRSEYLVDAEVFSKVTGRPFQVEEIVAKVKEILR